MKSQSRFAIRRPFVRAAFLVAASIAIAVPPSEADTLTKDISGTNFTWKNNSGSPDWLNSSSGNTPATWVNASNNQAVLTNTGGAATVALEGPITLTGAAGVTPPGLKVGGDGITIDTRGGSFGGSGGIFFANSGAIFGNANNTYSGGTIVDAGKTLFLGSTALGTGALSSSILGSGALSLKNSASLTIQGEAAAALSGFSFANAINADAPNVSSNTITLATAGATITLTGDITGAGGGINFVISTGGTIRLSNIAAGSGVLNFTGNAASDSTFQIGGDAAAAAVTVNNATLKIGNAGNGGALNSAIVLGSSSVLVFDRNNDVTHSGNISGDGSIQKLNANTLVLSGTLNNSQGLTVTEGTLQLAKKVGGSFGGTVVVSGSASVLELAQADTFTASGASPVSVTAGATLSARGYNPLDGLTLDSGKLLILEGSAGDRTQAFALGAAVNVGGTGGSPSFPAVSAITADAAVAPTVGVHLGSVAAAVSTTIFSIADNARLDVTVPLLDQGGTGATAASSLVKNGTGELSLSGNNSAGFSGTVTLNAGTLRLKDSTSLRTNGGSVTPYTFAGGTLALGSSANTYSQSWAITAASPIIDVAAGNATISGKLSGDGAFTKTGAGTLTLTNAANSASDFGVTISQGTLTLDSAAALGQGTTNKNTLDGGTLHLGGSEPEKTFTFTNGWDVGASGGNLRVATADQTRIFAANLTASGGPATLYKTGAGKLVFQETSPSGIDFQLTANTGAFVVSGASSNWAGDVSGDSGTTVGVTYGGAIGGVTLAGNSTFISGKGGTMGTLNLNGNVTIRLEGGGSSTLDSPVSADAAVVTNLGGSATVLTLDATALVSQFENGIRLPIFSYITDTLATPSWIIPLNADVRPTLTVEKDDTTSAYYLKVTGAVSAQLQWIANSSVTSIWNRGTSAWWNSLGGQDYFYHGDEVTFGTPLSPDARVVTITENVSPKSVAVNTPNAGDFYTFNSAGGAKITGGATFLKTGLGNLTIENSNDYTGGTAIKGGALITAKKADSFGSGPITITNETSAPIRLDFALDAPADITNPITADGNARGVSITAPADITGGVTFTGATGNSLRLHNGATGGSAITVQTDVEVTAADDKLTLHLPGESTFAGALAGAGTLYLADTAGSSLTLRQNSPPSAFTGTLSVAGGTLAFTGTAPEWADATVEATGAADTVLHFKGGAAAAADAKKIKVKEVSLSGGSIVVRGDTHLSNPALNYQPILDITGGKITRTGDASQTASLEGFATSASGTLTLETAGAGKTTWGDFTLIGAGKIVTFNYAGAALAASYTGGASTTNFTKTGAGELLLNGGGIPDAGNNDAKFTIEAGSVTVAHNATYGKTYEVKNGASLAITGSHDNAVTGRTFTLESGSSLGISDFYTGSAPPVAMGENIKIGGSGNVTLERSSLLLATGSLVALAETSVIELKDSTLSHAAGATPVKWMDNKAALLLDAASALDMNGVDGTNGVIVGALKGAGEIRNSGTAARTLTVGVGITAPAAEALFSGKIVSTTVATDVNLTKKGYGTQILTGIVNSPTVKVEAGTLQFGSATATPSYAPRGGAGTLTVADGANVVFFVPTDADAAVSISGAGSITKNGGREFKVSGVGQTYTGTTRVLGGTLNFSQAATELYGSTTANSYIEVASGAALKASIINLGWGSSALTSYAGHAKTLQTAPAFDLEGNVVLKEMHILQVGKDTGFSPTTPVFSALNIKGGLTMLNTDNVLRLDIASMDERDEINVSGAFTVSSNAKIQVGTSGGILLARSTAIDPDGTFYPLVTAGSFVGTDLLTNPNTAISLPGLSSSPSATNTVEIRGDVLGVLVKRNAVQYIWDGSVLGNEWNLSDSNWEKYDGFSSTSDSTFESYGAAILREGGGAATDITITGEVNPFVLIVEDADPFAPDANGGFTLVADTDAKITGGGGIEKTSAGTLTLKAGADTDNANDFTGAVLIFGGKLLLDNTENDAIALIADKGVASLIGKGSLADDLHLDKGAVLQFKSNETEVSTDRAFTVGANGGKIENLGAALLRFTGTDALRTSGTGDAAIALRTLEIAATTGGITLNNEIPSLLEIKKTGAGTLWLTGTNNAAAGKITVAEGTLALAAGTSVGATAGVELAGGTLSNAPLSAPAPDIVLNAPIHISSDSTIEVQGAAETFIEAQGAITSAGAQTLTKTGAGTLALGAENSGLSGTLAVTAGALRLDAAAATGNASVSLDSGATLLLNTPAAAPEVVIRGISGDLDSVIESAVAGAVRTVNFDIGSAAPGTFGGVLRDGATGAKLAIRKTGAGTLTLTNAASTASGTVTVEAGILRPASAAVLSGAEKFVVIPGGTFDINGGNYFGKTAEVSGNGHAAGGAFADSTGGGTFPALRLDGDTMLRTSGSSTLTAAAVLGTPADAPVLTLAPDVAPVAAAATKTFTLGSGVVAGVNLDIAPGATLALTAAALAASTEVKLHAGPDAGTDGALRLDGGVTQTVANIEGNGTVTGQGTLTVLVPESTSKTFAGTLREGVGLTLEGSGEFTLAPAGGQNFTNGIITVSQGTLNLSTMQASGEFDEFGKRGVGGSTVRLTDGTLRLTNAAPAQTDRTFVLTGATSTFSASGAGLEVLPGARFDVAPGTAHTLVLDGTATANSFAAPLADPTGGTLALRKTGAGTWAVGNADAPNTNLHTGGVTITEGAILLAADGALGVSGTLTLGDEETNSSGNLVLDGHAQTFTSIVVKGEGADNRVVNNSATTGALTLDIAGDVTFGGIFGKRGASAEALAASNFSVTKTGAGTLTFHLDEAHSNQQPFAHTGATTVSAGTLKLSGAARLESSKIIVADGATLDVSEMAGDFGITIRGGQTFTAGGAWSEGHYDVKGSLTLDGGVLEIGSSLPGAAERKLTISAAGSTFRVRTASDLLFSLTGDLDNAGNSLLYASNLSLDATTRVNVNHLDGTLAIGSYLLANYAGTLNPGGFAKLVFPDADGESYLDARYALTLVHNPDTKSIYLNVASTASAETLVTWVGDIQDGSGRGIWTPTEDNFTSPAGGRAGYFPGDSALFDDNAVSTNVLVGTNTSIGYIVFKNDLDYTVSGEPIRGEGWLEKRGSGKLTLLSENKYEGIAGAPSTYLVNGTLEVGHDLALGAGALAITSNATLAAINGARTLANDIWLDTGVVATFDSGAASLTLTGRLSGGTAATIRKSGAGFLQLPADGAAFTGTVDVRSGTLRLAAADYSKAIFSLDTGGTLGLSGGSAVGELRGESGSAITGSGLLEVGARAAVSTFAGDLSGGFALRLIGTPATALTLTGDNDAHSGAVEVLAGRLQIGDGVSGKAGSGAFTVAAGGRLVFNLPAADTLAQPFHGAGSVEKQGAQALEITNANADFAGTFRVSGGTLLLTGGGGFGTASVEIQSGVVLLARTGDYVLTNAISGAGTLVKGGGSGSATWLGTGSVNLRVQEGAFSIGDGVTPVNQRQMLPSRVDGGAELLLNPAAGGAIILGDLDAESGSTVLKTGAGDATFAGNVNARSGISVQAGRLSIGDGTGGGAVTLLGLVDVQNADATLVFDRTGPIHVPAIISSAGGTVEVRGTGTVFQSAGNAITGALNLVEGSVLQVGDTATPSRLNDGTGALTVNIADGATLRFAESSLLANVEHPGLGTVTGGTIVLRGTGTAEYRAGGTLRQNGYIADFAGTFRAAQGTYILNAASLPAAATLDATNLGELRIESAAATVTIAPAFGDGDGTVLLAPASGEPFASPALATFRLQARGASEPNFANGTLAIASNATLELAPGAASLTAREFSVRSGGTLAGAGALTGTLRNAGTVRPTGAGISVTGDFHLDGALEIAVAAPAIQNMQGGILYRAPAITYGGTLHIGDGATVLLQTTADIHEELRNGGEVQFLRDAESGAQGKPDYVVATASGRLFPTVSLSADGAAPVELPALTYSKGDGWLTMTLAEKIADIPHIRQRLHKGNGKFDGHGSFVNYLDRILSPADPANPADPTGALATVICGLLNSGGGAANAINAASPVGLASATAMSIASARADSADLHSHLEASRYTRYQRKSLADTGFYLSGTTHFEQNATLNAPAWDANIYGGTVGFDQAIGLDFLAGLSAGYHKGRATLDYGAGRVYQDNARLTAYASAQIHEKLYIDFALRAGLSSHSITHNTGNYDRPDPETGARVARTATAKPDGHDFGASVFLGSALGLTRTLSITPYAGADYDYARLEAFTEKGSHGDFNNDAALRLDSFTQESLRLKVGATLNYLLDQQLFRTARLSFDLGYSNELLHTDTALSGSFAAAAGADRFDLRAPALPRHILHLAPSVEVGFTENTSFQLTYRFESDFAHQTAHHLNATFRLRF